MSKWMSAALVLCGVACPVTAAKGPGEKAWRSFRGESEFRGVAPGSLANQFELAWTFKTDEPIKSSPVIDRGAIFIGSDDTYVYALNMTNGEQLWAAKTNGAVEAPPLVVGDRVFVGSGDSVLYALHRASGDTLWTYLTGGQIVGSANWFKGGGDAGSVLVGSYDNHLHCVDAATGEPRWKIATDDYINGAAAISNNKIVFGGCDGIIYVATVDRGDVLAEIAVGSPIAGTVAVADGRGYIGHYGNEFVSIDLRTNQIAWKFRDRQFPFLSSAAIADHRVVFGSRAKRVYCVDAETGEELWQFKLPGVGGKVDSSPVICGDKVVVGAEDGRLYVLWLETGEKVWSYEIGESITASPAVAGGMIVISAEDGTVCAFRPKQPEKQIRAEEQ